MWGVCYRLWNVNYEGDIPIIELHRMDVDTLDNWLDVAGKKLTDTLGRDLARQQSLIEALGLAGHPILNNAIKYLPPGTVGHGANVFG